MSNFDNFQSEPSDDPKYSIYEKNKEFLKMHSPIIYLIRKNNKNQKDTTSQNFTDCYDEFFE